MEIRNILLIVAAAGTALAADLPYAGKWKMDPAKSDFAGTTVTYASLPSGEWQSTAEGRTYKFKMDGKEYPDGLGDTAAWKPADANTWEVTWKLNGKVPMTETLKLGAGGSTLTSQFKGVKPNGEAMDETANFQRVSGGPGLAGKWKTTTVKSSSPEVLELVSSGSDGFSYKEPAMGLACDGKLDGKDYPCSGPALPPGWTVAMTKAGARSLDIMVKKDNKPFYKVKYTVAADGKSMTATGGATATNEKVKIMYDRQ
jgi:hypothetical protein